MTEETRTNEYQENADGQLELKGIDTPLGAAANTYLESVRDLNTAREGVEFTREKVLEKMEEIGKSSFLFEGKTFTKVKGIVKNDTLRISN